MKRIELHIPTMGNDGAAFPITLFDEVESDLLDLAGGFTSHLAEGKWRSPSGRVYVDPQVVYTVDANPELGAQEVDALRAKVKRLFSQEEVYLVEYQLER